MTEAVAGATATQLRALGANVVLAPVADVTRGGSPDPLDGRTFGRDPATVAEHVAATVRGYVQADVATAVKHFPGLGSTTTDSHVAMPTASASLEEWLEIDVAPFVAAITADTPIVVIGHVRFPALDPSATPATVSVEIITGELRGCLGFPGVIMTDALEMGAVGSIGSQGEAAVGALSAGVDMILLTSDFVGAREAIVSAVNEGILSEDRVDASARRVLDLKERLGILDATAIPPAPGITDFEMESTEELAASVAAACAEAGIDC
jgi:beta-N-acetylhexosaminidase